MTHGEYIRRLKKWRQILYYRVVVKKPGNQPLSQLSPYLAQIRGEHCPRPLDAAAAAASGGKPSLSPMEIPGQYQTCTGLPHPEVSYHYYFDTFRLFLTRSWASVCSFM